jgi:hypothetical protein
MAQLQGYFLLYKDDPEGASRHLDKVKGENARGVGRGGRGEGSGDTKRSGSEDTAASVASGSSGDDTPVIGTPPRRGPRRALTAHELDKMPFNPQYDWESGIHDPSK